MISEVLPRAPLDHQPVVYNRKSHAEKKCLKSFREPDRKLCSSPDPLLGLPRG